MTDRLDFELDLDSVLSVCLDRLRDGDSVEACLASYPSHVERLAPVLRMAAMMQASSAPAMSVEGLRIGEARLLARAGELRASRKVSSSARRGLFSTLLAGTRRLATATLVGVLLLCGVVSVGTVSAASTSLPGSPLYSVKRATETLVSSVAFTPQLRARAHLNWAERRLREAEALIARDEVVEESVLIAMEEETRQALVAAEQAGIDEVTAVVVLTERQQQVLSQLLEKVPPAARTGLERALAASAHGNAQARSAQERAATRGPSITPPGQAGKEPPGKKATEAPSAVEKPDLPDETPAAVDKLHPPAKGQGQGNAVNPDRGQGHGYGQDKDTDTTHPSGKDKDQGGDPSPGGAPGQGGDKDNEQGKGATPASGRGYGQGQGGGKDK